MYEQVEKPKGNKSRAVANSVDQKKSNLKQGLGFVVHRPEAVLHSKMVGISHNSNDRDQISHTNNFSKSSIQLMAQGNQQVAVQERHHALMQIQPPNFINAPDPADVVSATAALDNIRVQIEQAVNANQLMDQPHGGNMAELRARFHNDHVWRTFRGGVDAGHAQRTRELLADRIANRALEATRARARNQRAAIQAEIVQL